MRGAPLNSALVHILSRIIPADAGSTYGSTSIPLGCGEHIPGRRLVQLIGDHPRGCGEHYVYMDRRTHEQGIIPADAGSTQIGQPLSSYI